MLGPLSLNPFFTPIEIEAEIPDCILVLLAFWNVPVKSSPLWKLTNNSVEIGTYLSKLKHANVVSVYKGEHKTDPSNYRPISLLFVYDSIFAKTIYRRLMAYLEINDIVCSSQYGFRKKHSTEHALIDIVNQIQSHFDKGMLSCGVFIALKKKLLMRFTIAFYLKKSITMALEVLSMIGSVHNSLIRFN